MRRNIFTLLLLTLCSIVFGQRGRTISFTDKNTKSEISLQKLYVDVSVVENIATTTFEMHFYNSRNRVAEGELNFPLPEGATVFRYALDITGEMREGVVVEKEKATQVFESITRRRVDPGILEKTKGNSYRTRIYPIPPKGYKKVIIAYEEELPLIENTFAYRLPFLLEKTLEDVSIKITSYNNKIIKVNNSRSIDLTLKKKGNAYTAFFNTKNEKIKSQIAFDIDKEDEVKTVSAYKGEVFNSSYFYINTFPVKEHRAKKKPQNITVLWDASLSGKKRDIEKDLALLEAYLQWIGNAKVELVTFANDVHNPIKLNVENGKWVELQQTLTSIEYDGATCLSCIDFNAFNADEIILFSDGIDNFMSHKPKQSNTPIVAVTSNPQTDFSYLQFLAESSGGQYVNLNVLNEKEALDRLKVQTKQFIKAESLNNNSVDLYPSSSEYLHNSFSLSGRIAGQKDVLKLYFGFGDEITETKTIVINNSNPEPNSITERIWAKKRLKELTRFQEANEEKIIALSKQFQIVTSFTSLIVLEELSDYLQYEITPPPSLVAEYNRQLKNRQEKFETDSITHLKRIKSNFLNSVEWWKGEPKPVKQMKPSQNTTSNVNPQQSRDNESSGQESSGERIITGTIVDQDGPIIQGAVMVKGTTRGTVTDFDGMYSIVVPNDSAVLVYSYLGYETLEKPVRGQATIDVYMEMDNTVIQEIVYGYSVQRREDVNGAITEVDQAMQGKAAGVQVTNSSGTPGAGVQVRIRGTNSINTGYNTTDNSVQQSESSDNTSRRINSPQSSIELQTWNSDATYMKVLKQADEKDIYAKYLEIKQNYEDVPSFFFDVASYLSLKGESEKALRVISNLCELEMENHELLRSLGRKLSEFGFYDEAVYVFREVMKIRSFEPHSYRDLGLALAANKEYQEAVEVLYSVITTQWDADVSTRFRGIEQIVLNDLNRIIYKHKNELKDISFIDEALIKNMPVDIRIVIDWDANDTDIDLWVTDPAGEKCSYQNKNTKLGGRISNDIKQGYGPEEFLLKNAIEGKYTIEANFYGSSKQSYVGAVTVRAFIYTNFGEKNEKCEEITIQITEKNNKKYLVGSVEFVKDK